MSRVARPFTLVAGGASVASPGEPFPAPAERALAGTIAGLPGPGRPTLSEVFAAHPRDGGWAGFLTSGHTNPAGPVLWVQERMAILESGRIFPPGLPIGDLIHVTASDSRSALWAMEEGLRCRALSLVVGEIWGNPAALNFTATRRLAVAAERNGVAVYLIRLGGHPNLSGARMRWRLSSLPSLANPLDPRAPGAPAWDAELFRARGRPPGRWQVTHEADAANPVRLAAAPRDRTLGEDRRRA